MQQIDNRGFFSLFARGTQLFLLQAKNTAFYLLLLGWLFVNGLCRFMTGKTVLDITTNLRLDTFDQTTFVDLIERYTPQLYQLSLIVLLNYICIFLLIYTAIFHLCKTRLSKINSRLIRFRFAKVVSAFVLSFSFLVLASMTSFLVLPMVLLIAASALSVFLTIRYPKKNFWWVLKQSLYLNFVQTKTRKYFLNAIDLMGLSLFFVIFIDVVASRTPLLLNLWKASPSMEYLHLSGFAPSWASLCVWFIQTSLFFVVLMQYLCCVFVFSKKNNFLKMM